MSCPDKALQIFADRLRRRTPPHRLRETLEASLVPLVRRALRSGAGLPQLVQWVQKTLPQVQAGQDRTRPVDPEGAPRLWPVYSVRDCCRKGRPAGPWRPKPYSACEPFTKPGERRG